MSRMILLVALLATSNAVADPKSLDGAYTCQFEIVGSAIGPLAEQPCAITADTLVMTGGPKRIRGKVSATPKGFDFVGGFECADTDCAEKTKGSFTRKGTSYVGALPSNGKQITVTVRPAK